MPWDPSERPRKPRIRTTHHFVPLDEDRRRRLCEPIQVLAKPELERLADMVPQKLPRSLLLHFLDGAVRTFGWERQDVAPPRPLVRYELRLLAHLLWKYCQNGQDREAVEHQFFSTFNRIDPETRSRLLAGIGAVLGPGEVPEYAIYGPRGVRLGIAYEGALLADKRLRGRGDYRDVALHKTAAFLAFIYDMWDFSFPGLGKVGTGPVASNGNRRRVATSRFAQFAFAFFGLMDPKLSRERITSALNQHLAKARRQKDAGWSDYHDLVNLLHSE